MLQQIPCITQISTLDSHCSAIVCFFLFLLPLTPFVKLNKPPLSIKPPPFCKQWKCQNLDPAYNGKTRNNTILSYSYQPYETLIFELQHSLIRINILSSSRRMNQVQIYITSVKPAKIEPNIHFQRLET